MSYILIIFGLGFIIFFHELGHFLMGRALSIPIARFSIGFGPKLWEFKKGKTEFRISAIPLGGYVMPAFEEIDDMFNVPVYKRILFSMAGPIANIFLAITTFAIYNIIQSGGTFLNIFMEPVKQTYEAMGRILFALPQIFSQPKKLSGMIGIVVEGGKFVKSGVFNSLLFFIMLNLNFAILNLLPIPALDGGKAIMTFLEKFSKKVKKVFVPLTVAGWIFLIGIMVYSFVMDIVKYTT